MSTEGFDAGRFEFRAVSELVDSLGRAHAEVAMLKLRVEELEAVLDPTTVPPPQEISWEEAQILELCERVDALDKCLDGGGRALRLIRNRVQVIEEWLRGRGWGTGVGLIEADMPELEGQGDSQGA